MAENSTGSNTDNKENGKRTIISNAGIDSAKLITECIEKQANNFWEKASTVANQATSDTLKTFEGTTTRLMNQAGDVVKDVIAANADYIEGLAKAIRERLREASEASLQAVWQLWLKVENEIGRAFFRNSMNGMGYAVSVIDIFYSGKILSESATMDFGFWMDASYLSAKVASALAHAGGTIDKPHLQFALLFANVLYHPFRRSGGLLILQNVGEQIWSYRGGCNWKTKVGLVALAGSATVGAVVLVGRAFVKPDTQTAVQQQAKQSSANTTLGNGDTTE